MEYEILERKHSDLIERFSCVETEEMLKNVSSKYKRRIKKHSEEMENFLKFEALIEQDLQTSKTHLLLDDSGADIIAYVSLCIMLHEI